MGSGATKTGPQGSLYPTACGAQSPSSYSISHIFTPVTAALGSCWNRNEQSQARFLCLCFPTPPVLWQEQSPGSCHCGQGTNVSCCIPMLLVIRAVRCSASSAKHAPQLTFPRRRISVLICGFTLSAVPGHRGCDPLLSFPMAHTQAGTLSGMLGRSAGQKHLAAGCAGRQGMLQAWCAHRARLGTGYHLEGVS